MEAMSANLIIFRFLFSVDSCFLRLFGFISAYDTINQGLMSIRPQKTTKAATLSDYGFCFSEKSA
jgi:hypothetical protein